MFNNHLLAGFEKYAPGYRPGNNFGPAGRPPGQAVQQAFDANPAFAAAYTQFGNSYTALDAATAGGMAFLEAELEKRDTKVREPLTSITYPRDIDIKSGGGWVDYTSTFQVNYGISGANNLGFIGGQTNQIPVVQADVSKDIWPVTNWGNVMKVTFIDLQKSAQAGRSLDDMYDKAIRLNWNKTLDLTTYLGWGTNYGLVNNPGVTQSSVPAGAAGYTQWQYKTPNEIAYDIGTALVQTWAGAQYDVSGMADVILIPPTDYTYIAETPMTLAGNETILEWLLKKNVAKTQGRDLSIFPSRWCSGAGVSGTNRMVAYCRDVDRVYLDITVPVQRIMTQPTVQEGGAYLTLFLGQIGVTKFLFGTQGSAGSCVQYFDGI